MTNDMSEMQAAIKELQDTAVVMAGIQARQAAIVKDHGEWLEAHDRAIGRMRAEDETYRAEERERGRLLDERIDRLVVAIGELIRREGN